MTLEAFPFNWHSIMRVLIPAVAMVNEGKYKKMHASLWEAVYLKKLAKHVTVVPPLEQHSPVLT
jgi:hypothetical protein